MSEHPLGRASLFSSSLAQRLGLGVLLSLGLWCLVGWAQ